MANDVFISHSSKDKTVADATCAVLEAKGIRCWIAPRDIVPGKDYGEALIDAINTVRVMVLIFSANANQSPQIKREVERAVSHGIPIIPVRIEEIVPTKSLEYFLSTPHWLDAYTPPLEKHLNYLAEVVSHILEGKDIPEDERRLRPPFVVPGRYDFLQDRRVLIGGGAGALVLAFLAWLIFVPGTPPSFVGKWTAEKVSVTSLGQGMGIPSYGTDIFTKAALAASAITGSFEVNQLGQYKYVSGGEDHGSISWDGAQITFTSDLSHASTTMKYFLLSPVQAASFVTNLGGSDGDSALVLNPPIPMVQTSLVGKPSGGTGPTGAIAGHWHLTFTGFVGGVSSASLDITADGHYRFRGEIVENGLWQAADGKWTRSPQGGPPVSGTYQFDGSDQVTCAAANGTTVWKREES